MHDDGSGSGGGGSGTLWTPSLIMQASNHQRFGQPTSVPIVQPSKWTLESARVGALAEEEDGISTGSGAGSDGGSDGGGTGRVGLDHMYVASGWAVSVPTDSPRWARFESLDQSPSLRPVGVVEPAARPRVSRLAPLPPPAPGSTELKPVRSSPVALYSLYPGGAPGLGGSPRPYFVGAAGVGRTPTASSKTSPTTPIRALPPYTPSLHAVPMGDGEEDTVVILDIPRVSPAMLPDVDDVEDDHLEEHQMAMTVFSLPQPAQELPPLPTDNQEPATPKLTAEPAAEPPAQPEPHPNLAALQEEPTASLGAGEPPLLGQTIWSKFTKSLRGSVFGSKKTAAVAKAPAEAGGVSPPLPPELKRTRSRTLSLSTVLGAAAAVTAPRESRKSAPAPYLTPRSSATAVEGAASATAGLPSRDKRQLYRYLKTLGVGVQGTVSLRLHVPTRAVVALKTMNTALSQVDADVRQSYRREVAILRMAAVHPNVIRLLDCWEGRNKVYQVFELAGGGDLETAFHGVAASEAEAVRLLAPVVDAVRFLHDMRVLHRDVRPANVMLRRPLSGSESLQELQSIPILGDFGIATFESHSGRLATNYGE
ncbi:hypothetical protein HK405_009815, partial [Cladochytrium tenue]